MECSLLLLLLNNSDDIFIMYLKVKDFSNFSFIFLFKNVKIVHLYVVPVHGHMVVPVWPLVLVDDCQDVEELMDYCSLDGQTKLLHTAFQFISWHFCSLFFNNRNQLLIKLIFQSCTFF